MPADGCRPGSAEQDLERWQEALRSAGVTPAERSAWRDGLLAFVRRHRLTPAELLATWEDYPELTVRRRPRSDAVPNRAVESFLIHNGVNVFGDIVCVASRPDDLATQGPQFTPPSSRDD